MPNTTSRKPYGSLANIPREQILQRIASGELAVKVAESLGVHKSAISHAFEADAEYAKARELGMSVRLEMGEQAIEDAGDDLNLARVREIQQRRREWRAEREFPHRWGQRSTVTVEHVDLGDALRRARERVIDGECVAIAQQPEAQSVESADNASYVKSDSAPDVAPAQQDATA